MRTYSTGLRRCVASALAACARLSVHVTTFCLDQAEALNPIPEAIAEQAIDRIWARVQAGIRPAPQPFVPSHAARIAAAYVAKHNQPAWIEGQNIYLTQRPSQETRPS